ncbi:MAG: hypothetical protein U0X41_09465 [Chitinophagales bacterium]
MKIPSIYRLYWMLLLLIPVLTVSAKNNKENALQQGKLTLANGTVLNGWLSIRISHGEDEVLYKKERTGTKIYSYPVSELSDFSIGHSHYKVQYIPLQGDKSQLAILESITKGEDKLYKASYYQEFALGKNNSVIKRVESYYLKHLGRYLVLSGNDFKERLKDIWADEQAYLEKLNSYEKVGVEELHELLVD